MLTIKRQKNALFLDVTKSSPFLTSLMKKLIVFSFCLHLVCFFLFKIQKNIESPVHIHPITLIEISIGTSTDSLSSFASPTPPKDQSGILPKLMKNLEEKAPPLPSLPTIKPFLSSSRSSLTTDSFLSFDPMEKARFANYFHQPTFLPIQRIYTPFKLTVCEPLKSRLISSIEPSFQHTSKPIHQYYLSFFVQVDPFSGKPYSIAIQNSSGDYELDKKGEGYIKKLTFSSNLDAEIIQGIVECFIEMPKETLEDTYD